MFNPRYSKNVVTEGGHYFLKLLNRHFPRQHKLDKTFNRNTVKVSYSRTKDIKSINNSRNENNFTSKLTVLKRTKVQLHKERVKRKLFS